MDLRDNHGVAEARTEAENRTVTGLRADRIDLTWPRVLTARTLQYYPGKSATQAQPAPWGSGRGVASWTRSWGPVGYLRVVERISR